MRGRERRRRQELEGEVAIGDGIERIGRGPVEAERARRHLAVDRERGAGQRRGAERRFIEPRRARPRSGRDRDRTSRHRRAGGGRSVTGCADLQMGEAGHDRADVRFGLGDQRALQALQGCLDAVDRVAHPEPEVERHLVVARPRRVQASGRVADQLGEARLDVHMDVFERDAEGECAVFDLALDPVEASRIAAPSVFERTPAATSMRQWAREPAMSWA